MYRRKIVLTAIIPLAFCLLLFLAWLNPHGKSIMSVILFQVRGRTGTIHFVLENGGRVREHYNIDGLREGVWRRLDKDGNLVHQCEYRNGGPWDGVCRFSDMKAWLCEYRQGKPWNGLLPSTVDSDYPSGWGWFVDGKDVGYRDYCEKSGHDRRPDHHFYCLHYLGTTKNQGIIHNNAIHLDGDSATQDSVSNGRVKK